MVVPSTTSRKTAAARAAAVLILCVAPFAISRGTAHAHDFWIQPATFDAPAKDPGKTAPPETVPPETVPSETVPPKTEAVKTEAVKPGTPIDLRLIIGHDEVRTEYKRDPLHLLNFLCFRPSGTRLDVPGEYGGVGGRLAIDEPGTHLFAYRSAWTYHSLPPDRFGAYLKKEDLREAYAKHTQQMAGGKPTDRTGAVREIKEGFARCAKSLALGGTAKQDRSAGKFDRVVGLPFEIVAENNPSAHPLNQPLTFRVLQAGKPLVSARLAAYREQEPKRVIEVRTDAEGRGQLTLDKPGMWIVRCIYIRHVATSTVDWLSLWATLTFDRSETAALPKAQ